MSKRLAPLKRFGQHFLVDKNITRKIATAAAVSKEESVLEIGPGRGALTFDLARDAGFLVAVELDRALAGELQKSFCDDARVRIVCGNILKINLDRLAEKCGVERFKVVANLPYYITTPAIAHLLKYRALFSDLFLTVQKEVAERMSARPRTNAYGSFSCFLNYHAQVQTLFLIKRTSFRPVPKVTSAFVRIHLRKNPKIFFGLKSEKIFFEILRVSFGQRRKKIAGPLAGVVPPRVLAVCDAELLSRRPQDLSLQDFVRLSNQIFDIQKES